MKRVALSVIYKAFYKLGIPLGVVSANAIGATAIVTPKAAAPWRNFLSVD